MSTEANTPDEHVDLLLSEVDRLNLEDVFPEPVQAFRLWQIFLERVNPLTKVIHVPSLQPYIVEAASNFQNVPASVKSLLFSIYTLTVLSLDEAECRHILRCSRSEALRNYSDGARAALKNTQFLRTYDMPTLQALVLYMVRPIHASFYGVGYTNHVFYSCPYKADTTATVPGCLMAS